MWQHLDHYRSQLESTDACSNCGVCMSFCAWDEYESANPGQRGSAAICRDCMLCFRICPRARSNPNELEVELFGESRENPFLGYYRASWGAKAVVRADGAQDGGVTTALLAMLLRQGTVDAALVTGRDALWQPVPTVATTVEEIVASAGSKYTASPALSILKSATEQYERLAFVGMPCQIAALRNLQKRHDPRYKAERVIVVLGLFCAESFSYGQPGSHGVARWVEEELDIPLHTVTRFDIKKNNLMVFSPNRSEGRPLAEIGKLSWPICHTCRDFTAELADIAVGAVGSKADQNSILARSALGEEIVSQAGHAGILELAEVRNFAIIERITRNKLTRREELSPEELRFLLKQTIRGNWKKAQKE